MEAALLGLLGHLPVLIVRLAAFIVVKIFSKALGVSMEWLTDESGTL